MTKSKITKDELAGLKRMGFVEGKPNTIPENISPVLKSRLLAEMGENDAGSTPGEAGGPEALKAREARYAEQADPLDHDRDGKKGGHIDNRNGWR